MKFGMAADERLIVAVSDNHVIFDMTTKGYHDNNVKNRAWRDVSVHLGVSVEECKKKWKYLRDKYLKERKQEKKQKRGGANNTTRNKRWKYMAILGFLAPHCKTRATTSNLFVQGGEEDAEVSSEVEALPTPMMSPKREVEEREEEAAAGPAPPPEEEHPPSTSTSVPFKSPRNGTQPLTHYQESLLSTINREVDGDEHYMLSLVPTLRRLSDYKKRLARIGIEKILLDLEFGPEIEMCVI